MRFKVIGFIFFVLIFSQLASAQSDSLQLNYDTVMSKLNANRVAYHTLSARAKMTWTDNDGEQNFQANIRMAKDSLVWLSLTGAMGIEGARVLITPDSVQILNKMAGEYVVHDFNYVQNWVLFPVNFKMLQQIIAGEKIDITERGAAALRQDSVTALVYIETDKLHEKLWVNTQNYTIAKILLKDKLLTQDMTVTFEGYADAEGKPFSYTRHIEVHRNGITMKLDMDITKLRWNEELTYPFEVSDKYKR